MMYRQIQKSIQVNIVFDSGGLGDLIGRLPVCKWIYDNHPHVDQHIWMPDFGVDLAKRSLPKSSRIIIRGFSQKHLYKEITSRAFDVHYHSNLSTHITEHAFHVVGNTTALQKEKNYLPVYTDDIDVTKFNLPEKYVVVATGFTTEVREFLPQYINTIVDYIKTKGYEVVFLGKEEINNGSGHTIKGNFKKEVDYTKGINLINSTSILETKKIIENAKCIVGLDNGLLHLAGTTEIPIVGGFTTVLPEHRMPYRHDILGWNYYPVTLTQKELACRGCQSLWTFTYDNAFDKCFYKDTACIKKLTPDKYITELEKIL